MCAFLAPEPIPESLFTAAASVLPGELAARAADPLAWRQTLAHMTRQSLARIDHRGLQIHRLTQAILRERLTPAQAAATRTYAEALLAASNPGDPPNPVTWPRWARLTPHVLAADLAATDSPALRELARHTCWYLIERGDTRTAHDLANGLRQHWRDRLGEDHQHTLTAAHYLAWTLLEMGHYAESRDLNQDTLARRRRVLGQDHPDTLASAHNLAINLRKLGDVEAACDLDRDTLDRHRRVLGQDHHSTLRSATILAHDLRELGEAQAAAASTATPSTAAAACWAKTTPTPWPPPPAWPPTCARWARQMMAHEAVTACTHDPIAEFTDPHRAHRRAGLFLDLQVIGVWRRGDGHVHDTGVAGEHPRRKRQGYRLMHAQGRRRRQGRLPRQQRAAAQRRARLPLPSTFASQGTRGVLSVSSRPPSPAWR